MSNPSNIPNTIPRFTGQEGRFPSRGDILGGTARVYWGLNQPIGRQVDTPVDLMNGYGLDVVTAEYVAPRSGPYVPPGAWVPEGLLKLPYIARFMPALGDDVGDPGDPLPRVGTVLQPMATAIPAAMAGRTDIYFGDFFTDAANNFIPLGVPPDGDGLVCPTINVVTWGCLYIPELTPAPGLPFSVEDAYGSQQLVIDNFNRSPYSRTVVCRDVGLEAYFFDNPDTGAGFEAEAIPFTMPLMAGLMDRMAAYGFVAGPQIDYRTMTAQDFVDIAVSALPA